MLTFKKNSWHWKAYLCYLDLKNSGIEVHVEADLEKRLDLCTYTRALLLWLPLRLTWRLSPLLAVLSVFILISYKSGLLSAFKWLATMAVCIFGAVLVFAFLDAVGGKWRTYKNDKLAENVGREPEPSVVLEWLKAKKAKVCPLIRVED